MFIYVNKKGMKIYIRQICTQINPIEEVCKF